MAHACYGQSIRLHISHGLPHLILNNPTKEDSVLLAHFGKMRHREVGQFAKDHTSTSRFELWSLRLMNSCPSFSPILLLSGAPNPQHLRKPPIFSLWQLFLGKVSGKASQKMLMVEQFDRQRSTQRNTTKRWYSSELFLKTVQLSLNPYAAAW